MFSATIAAGQPGTEGAAAATVDDESDVNDEFEERADWEPGYGDFMG